MLVFMFVSGCKEKKKSFKANIIAGMLHIKANFEGRSDKALPVCTTTDYMKSVHYCMVRIFLILLFSFPVMVVAQPLPALIPYKTKQGWGYSDSNRIMRIPARYKSAEMFYDNRAVVTILEKGKEVHCVIDN